ncbi:MAG TPA: MAPEG family protein [Polyangia bacterium]|jgi:hypothetical protein
MNDQADWRAERRAGIAIIAAAAAAAIPLWLAIRYLAPSPLGMESLGARMLYALKCTCLATLYGLVLGVEAVAHERLQSAAFDPLAPQTQSRRLQVNLRYLQNTLEQLIVFIVAIFGLAAYCSDGSSMRAVLATTVVWILARFAFWLGYHRSAAWRGLGAPGVALVLLVLLYVAARIGFDAAGVGGAVAAVGTFLGIEAILMRATRQ